MPNFRPKSERAPRALCWFSGSSVARAALAFTLGNSIPEPNDHWSLPEKAANQERS
jgi:hypothetical protein